MYFPEILQMSMNPLALLVQRSEEIMQLEFFDTNLQLFVHESISQSGHGLDVKDVKAVQQYIYQVDLIALMLASVIPVNSTNILEKTIEFCNGLLMSKKNNAIFAIKFFNYLEQLHPNIAAQHRLGNNQPISHGNLPSLTEVYRRAITNNTQLSFFPLASVERKFSK